MDNLIKIAEPSVKMISVPLFLDPESICAEALTDPDYRLKWLEKFYGKKYPVSCSKCHHCR